MLSIFFILTWECFAVSFLCWPGSLQPSQTIGYFRQSCSFLLPFPLSCLSTPPFLWRQTLFFFINCHTFVLFLYLSLSVCGSSFLMIHFPPVPWSEGQAVELICSSAKSSHTWPPRAQGQGGGLPTAEPPLDLKRGLFRNPPKSFVDILQSPEQAWKAMLINK